MNILITGGAGFIGANLSRAIPKKHRVKVYDNLSRGNRQYLPSHAELIIGDILDTETLKSAMDDSDIIVHLAAFGSVVESIEEPKENFKMNVEGTVSVLEAARASSVKKLIFASTGGAIMGNTPPPVNELSLPKPISPYGAGKLCGEAYCQAYAAAYGLSTTCLRFANVYGPYSGHKKGVITNFIKCIFRSEPFTIFGDGQSSRDYIHVDDLCAGILLAIEDSTEGNQIFHIASGRETKVSELAEIIKTIAGDPMHTINMEPARAGEVERNFADYSQANQSLGFQPKVALETGLKDTFKWYQENKNDVLSTRESLS